MLRQCAPYGYIKPKFLNKFALQTFSRQLVGCDLAAGEFPLERQAHRGASLRCKHSASFFNDCASYLQVPHGRNIQAVIISLMTLSAIPLMFQLL